MEKVPGIGGITDDRPDRFHVSTDPVRRPDRLPYPEADKVRRRRCDRVLDPVGNGRSVNNTSCRKITKDEDGETLPWVTKGDANNTEDQALVPAENLVGIYRHRVVQDLAVQPCFADHTGNDTLCDLSDPLMVVCDTICRRRNER